MDSDEDSVIIERVVEHRVSVKTGLLEFKIKGSDGGNVWVRHEEAEELCPTQLREFFVNNPGVEDSLKGKKKRSRLVKDVVAVFRQEKRDRKEQNKVTHAMLKKVAKENKKKGGTRKKAATKKKTAGPSTPVQPKSPRTAVPPSSRRTPPTPSSASSVGSKVQRERQETKARKALFDKGKRKAHLKTQKVVEVVGGKKSDGGVLLDCHLTPQQKREWITEDEFEAMEKVENYVDFRVTPTQVKPSDPNKVCEVKEHDVCIFIQTGDLRYWKEGWHLFGTVCFLCGDKLHNLSKATEPYVCCNWQGAARCKFVACSECHKKKIVANKTTAGSRPRRNKRTSTTN